MQERSTPLAKASNRPDAAAKSPQATSPGAAGDKPPFFLLVRLGLTRLAIAGERAVSAFWPAVALLAAAVAIALFGLFERLPGWLHLALLLGLGVAFLWLLWRGARRFSWPDEASAGQRMELASGLPHRPLTSAFDQLPPESKDPLAARLFALHRARARARLARLRAAPPGPALAAADPRGLSAAAALVLLVGFVVAGADWLPRLQAAVQPRLTGGVAALPPTLDAWLDPPDYTGFAPLYLSDLPPGGEPLAVPAGSRVIAQVQGGGAAPRLELDGQSETFDEAAPGLWKLDQELESGEHLSVRQGGDTLGSWQLHLLPDEPPQVRFTEPPAATERQALALSYGAEDDYGLDQVRLEIRRSDDPSLPPLMIDLMSLDKGRKEIKGRSYKDLTEHLWAGFPVEMTLTATDALGQEGRSETVRTALPERVFHHPVARALVELRKRLTLSPEQRLPVVRALDALIGQPEVYDYDSVVALGMSAAAGRLIHDRSAAAIAGVQKLLWDTALRLEDGDVSLMAQSLRDIQERLKQALENGASDEEIQRLIDELELAMQQYLQALQEEAMKRMEQGFEPQPLPEGAETMDSSDLRRMLDQMREMSQSGAREQAQQMLDQLQRMMENLQANPMAMMSNEQMQQSMEMMRRMEDLVRQQQQLLDESHQQSQRRGQQQMQGSPEQGEGQMQAQAEMQDRLRRELGEMMRELANQMGDLPSNLGHAEQAMREAGEALREGDAEGAIGPQTEALSQLQQGLQQMADQYMQQFIPGPGQGQGRRGARPGENLDPLGRQPGNASGDGADRIDIPEAGEMNRSRQILDELRKRRGETNRPPIERDYLDRLLEQF